MYKSQCNPFRTIREGAGLTVRAFAQHLGVSIPSIYNVEQGITKTPDDIIKSLAQ